MHGKTTPFLYTAKHSLMQKFIPLLFISQLLLLVCCASVFAEVKVYHTTDVHGTVIGAADGNAIGIDQIAGISGGSASLLLDSGDAISGNAYANLNKGVDIIQLMNAAGYDAMALGNHELDYGLSTLFERASEASFPILAANVVWKSSGTPFLQGVAYNGGMNNGVSAVFERDGKRIAVFGLTTPTTLQSVRPETTADLVFKDPVETARSVTAALRADGADEVICLFHWDGAEADKLAQTLGSDAPDLILAGHSHQTIAAHTIGQTLIEQAGVYANVLGEVTIPDSGSLSGRLLTPAEAYALSDANASVTILTTTLTTAVNEQLSLVIGHSDQTLWGGYVQNRAISRMESTPLGSWTTDTMQHYTVSQVKNTNYEALPVTAFYNGGGIRSSIAAGDISLLDLWNVYPYSNIIVVKLVSPSVLYSCAEAGLSNITAQDTNTGALTGAGGGFPQCAGMKLVYNPSAPVGSKVTSITLDNGTVLSREDSTTQILLATNDFLAGGGNGYTELAGCTTVAGGDDLITTLQQYTSLINNIQTTGRISTTGAYTPSNWKPVIKIASESPSSGIVNLQVDGQKVSASVVNGTLDLTVSDGAHRLTSDQEEVYVSNYSGIGTTDNPTVLSALVSPTAPVNPEQPVVPIVPAQPASASASTIKTNAATGMQNEVLPVLYGLICLSASVLTAICLRHRQEV